VAYDSTRVSNDLRNLLVAKFAWPTFTDSELRLFCDAIAEAIENELPNIELDAATVTDTDVSGVTVPGGDTLDADITNPGVTGGIK